MTSLYETWLTANPEMMADNSRWKHFIDAHPAIKNDPSARYLEFSQHYQRVHFPELWKIQNSSLKIVPFADKSQEQKSPRKRKRA